jgi:hypothetical protein
VHEVVCKKRERAGYIYIEREREVGIEGERDAKRSGIGKPLNVRRRMHKQ